MIKSRRSLVHEDRTASGNNRSGHMFNSRVRERTLHAFCTQTVPRKVHEVLTGKTQPLSTDVEDVTRTLQCASGPSWKGTMQSVDPIAHMRQMSQTYRTCSKCRQNKRSLEHSTSEFVVEQFSYCRSVIRRHFKSSGELFARLWRHIRTGKRSGDQAKTF